MVSLRLRAECHRHEIESLLRKQEAKMPTSTIETRAQFEARLDLIAKNLPKDSIDRSIINFKGRARKLFEATGGLFEEGWGRKKKRAPCSCKPLSDKSTVSLYLLPYACVMSENALIDNLARL